MSSTEEAVDLPAPLHGERTVRLSTDGLTTLRLMHDEPRTTGWERWFEEGVAAGGHQVRALVNGPEAFRAMHEAIETARKGDLVFLTGWVCDIDLPLAGGSSFAHAALAAAGRGAQVRVMLWRNVREAKDERSFSKDTATKMQAVRSFFPDGWREGEDLLIEPGGMFETGFLNRAGVTRKVDVAAICDEQTVFQGAHHMKALAVRAGKKVVGFVGGIDIDRSRLTALQDTHVRIEGQAAHDLLARLVARWEQHPKRPTGEHLGELVAAGPAPAGGPGRARVRVAFTFADGSRHGFVAGHEAYRFAPTGEKGVWRQLVHAIGQAKRFIYFENQYFFSRALVRVLKERLPDLEHMTFVLEVGQDAPEGDIRMRELVAELRAADPTGRKVRCFAMNRWNAGPTYMHSKTWIFDDELAIIGSANACSRSYTCDSEVAAAIWEPGGPDRPSWSFARKLRVRLWAQYLGLDTPEGHAQLADGVASAALWLEAPAYADGDSPTSRFKVQRLDDEGFAHAQKYLFKRVEDEGTPWWTYVSPVLGAKRWAGTGGKELVFDEVVDPWPADLE